MNKTIWALAFLVLCSGMTFAIGNATTTEVAQSGYDGETAAGSILTEGGNVSETDIGANQSTEKWAGFFGNVSGQLVLAEAAASPYMYSWTYSGTGGEVCASIDTNFPWADLQATLNATIDSVWGFDPNDADSANNTMTDTTGTVVVDAQTETSTAVTTEGNWQTVALGDGTEAATSDFAFCVNITSGGTNFKGGTSDYQLMVPANETVATYETYYFYVELI
ncbi:MAG: hypothetical protein GY852_08095 [bacterium]|nr:hypothetical protein [bacterium]